MACASPRADDIVVRAGTTPVHKLAGFIAKSTIFLTHSLAACRIQHPLDVAAETCPPSID